MFPPSQSTVTRSRPFSMDVARTTAIQGFCHLEIMHLLCVSAGLARGALWETTAPKDWTDEQVQLLLNDSPWAQLADPKPEVQIYLATARPVQQAEAELARRARSRSATIYLDYIQPGRLPERGAGRRLQELDRARRRAGRVAPDAG